MPFFPFLGEGSPTKIDYSKKGYSHSILSTGGPSPFAHRAGNLLSPSKPVKHNFPRIASTGPILTQTQVHVDTLLEGRRKGSQAETPQKKTSPNEQTLKLLGKDTKGLVIFAVEAHVRCFLSIALCICWTQSCVLGHLATWFELPLWLFVSARPAQQILLGRLQILLGTSATTACEHHMPKTRATHASMSYL